MALKERPRVLMFGFLGDFIDWKPVPYVIEYVDNAGKRRVARFEDRCNYVNFTTEIALLTHIIEKYKPSSINVVMYMPLTLLTSRTTLKVDKPKSEKSEVSLKKEFYDRVCTDKNSFGEISVADFAHKLMGVFNSKLVEVVRSLRGVNPCFDKQADILHEIYNIFNQIKLMLEEGRPILAANDEVSYSNSELVISVIPIPMALTHVCVGIKDLIVTYQMSNAAEKLATILFADMMWRTLNALATEDSKKDSDNIMVVIDSSHGVNYASASLVNAYGLLREWARAAVELLGRRTVTLMLYNSDPVVGPNYLQVGGLGAYKLHLVSYETIGENSLGQGMTQTFLTTMLGKLVSKSREVSYLKGLFNDCLLVAGVTDRGYANFAVLAFISASTGLPLWAVYYSSMLTRLLQTHLYHLEAKSEKYISDIAYLFRKISVRLLPLDKVKIAVNKKGVHTVVSVSFAEGEAEQRLLGSLLGSYVIASLSILMLLGASLTWKLPETHIGISYFSSTSPENQAVISIAGQRIHGLFNIRIEQRQRKREGREQHGGHDKECEIRCSDVQEDLRKLFRWITPQTMALLEAEFISDRNGEDERGEVYGYMPIVRDSRNLIAHAGLSRGAAILLRYETCRTCGSDESGECRGVKRLLAEAVLADSDSLRTMISQLIKEI